MATRPDALVTYGLLVPIAEARILIDENRKARREAAILALRAGCRITEVAQAAGVHRTTVTRWRREGLR